MDGIALYLSALQISSDNNNAFKRKRFLESRKKFLEEKEAYLLGKKQSLAEQITLLEGKRDLLVEKKKWLKEEVSRIEGELSVGCKLLMTSVFQHLSSFIFDIDEKIQSLDEIMELEEQKYRLEYKIREKRESIDHLFETYNKSEALPEEK